MFYSYEVSKDASDFLSEWGDEKQQYIDAILRGLIPTFMGIGHQLQLVCHRERIQPEVGFVFGIGLKYTQVEVLLRVEKIPCFMTLMPDVNEQAYLILSLKTKAEMEDERAWE
ncbi:hypothetical protein KJ885_03685, partial [Patescibacteria group bacterium]|nr:hypothetical protein [Patescibacteria group bacterium]